MKAWGGGGDGERRGEKKGRKGRRRSGERKEGTQREKGGKAEVKFVRKGR